MKTRIGRRSRVGLASVLAVVGVAGLLTGCGSDKGGASGGSTTIISGDLGGTFAQCQRDTVFANWSKATGNKVKFGSPNYDTGAWKVQNAAGRIEWDVVVLDAAQLQDLIDLGLIGSLGKEVTSIETINWPSAKVGDFAIGMEFTGNAISYRTDKFSSAPQSWADVFDTTRFPGKRLFHKSVADFGVLEMALMADGVAPENLYPLDVDRALRKLDTIKKDIVWYETGSQMVALLKQGDAVIGAGWDGRLKAIQKEGVPVAFNYNNAMLRPDYYAVPKKAPHADLARDLIKYAMQPDQQVAWAECSGYSPVAAGAYSQLPSSFKGAISSPSDPTKGVVVWNDKYWKDNRRAVTDKFNGWLGK